MACGKDIAQLRSNKQVYRWRMLIFGNDHSLDQHQTVAAPMRFLSACNLTTYIIVPCIPEIACKFCQLVLKDLPVLEKDRRTYLSCNAELSKIVSFHK